MMEAILAKNEVLAGRSKVRLGTRLIALGLLVLVAQGILWLDQGFWTPCNLQSVLRWLNLRPPMVEWAAVQQIVEWLFVFPLSAVPLALGFSIAWSGAARADRAGDPEKSFG